MEDRAHDRLAAEYRCLTVRYERHGHLSTAFLTLAAALIWYKKLIKMTT